MFDFGDSAQWVQRFFTPSSGRSLEKRFEDWYRVNDAFKEVVDRAKKLKVMDDFGCADRWAGFVADALVAAFGLLVAICDDIDDCMGQSQDVDATADDGIDKDALLDDFFVDLLVGLLQDRAGTVVGAQMRSDDVRDGITTVLKSAGLHGERASLGFEFDSDDSDEDITEVRTYGSAKPIATSTGFHVDPDKLLGLIGDSAGRSQDREALADDEKVNEEGNHGA